MQYKFYYNVQNTYTELNYNEWNRYMAYKYFKAKGLTKAAFAGIWGNIWHESFHGNPGQVEGGQIIPTTNSQGIPTSAAYRGGYGFIQWTDTSATSNKLLSYSISQDVAWYNGYLQCKLIYKELKNSEGWIPTPNYTYTTKEFMKLTDPEEAAAAYCYERERGTWSDSRSEKAREAYEASYTSPPTEPTGPYTINNGPGGGGSGKLPIWKMWEFVKFH